MRSFYCTNLEGQDSGTSAQFQAARANADAWNVIHSYISTSMGIPELHKGLESILGHDFTEDMDFWNVIITDVTAEPGEEHSALSNYQSLRARHVRN